MSLSAKPRENPLQRAFWTNFWILAVAIAFSFFAATLLLTVPLFILLIYDRVLPARSPETLMALMILSAGLIAIMGTLDFARRRLLARFGARIQEQLEDRTFRQSGVAESEALDGLRSFFHSSAAVSLVDVLWAPLFILAVFVLHPLFGWTAIIGLVTLTIVFVLGEVFSHHPREEAGRRREIVSRLKATVRQSGDVVGAHQMASKVRARWKEARAHSRVAAIRSKDRSAGFATLMRIVRIIFTLIILTVGASLVMEDQVTTGALVATVVLLNRVFSPVLNLFRHGRAIGAARQNWRLVDAQVRAAPPHPIAHRPDDRAPLVLDRVAIAGDRGGGSVLRNLSTSIAPGELVEIVGPSGSGKTLLCQTLLGLRTPRSGSVRIGDTPISLIPPRTMAGLFGYLPETIRFVEGTVFDAIAAADCSPEPEAVMRAARAARVHEMIQTLPGGYDFQLDTSGSALSKGERTLIGLARALYLQPRFLVLDAPSSIIGDAFGDQLEAVMTELMSEGTAILLVARQRQKLPAVARRARLEKGTLVEPPRLRSVRAPSSKPELVRSSS
jgi:ATP-binding cassette subfamily C protein